MRPLSKEGQTALRVAEDLIDNAKLEEAESVLLNIISREEPNRLVLHNIEDIYQQLRDVAETAEIVQSLPLIAQLLRAKADELELGQKIVASIA